MKRRRLPRKALKRNNCEEITAMKLVVGLGNPGREYAGTRHNIGFEVVDRLAERFGLASPGEFDRVARNKFEGLAIDGPSPGGSEKVLLLKPLTFMNLSGRVVQTAVAFYQLATADVIIVLDDLALACGRIRIRSEGSSGGHNGLKDIERALGTANYPRLRVGIDAPPPRVPGRDYVLGRFTDQQRPLIDRAVERSTAAIETWMSRGIAAAMNQFNADENAGDEKQV
jgi:peptidyl-tRNA hydrolase, PTH1 family